MRLLSPFQRAYYDFSRTSFLERSLFTRCHKSLEWTTQTRHRRLCSSQTTVLSSSLLFPKIGFIGLGNMGLPMIQNLAAFTSKKEEQGKGMPILAFDLNPVSRERASTISGIQVVDSVEQVSKQDVVITMLPGDAALRAVLETLQGRWIKEQNQREEQSHPRIVIDCSTVSPTTSRELSKTLQVSGTAVLFDAPVSGGVKGATDGTLTFMLGGCSQLLDTLDTSSLSLFVRPILETMGSRVIECGAHVGAGSAVKLCNNLALAAQMIGICEALNLGEALGVDPVVLTSVLNSSTAACWSAKVNNPHPVVASQEGGGTAPASRNYQGGFATNLMLKDLGLAMQVATEKHVALPLTGTAKELYQMASLQGRGTQDFGAILQVLRGQQEHQDTNKSP